MPAFWSGKKTPRASPATGRSYWQRHAQTKARVPKYEERTGSANHPDVVLIGGGFAGLMTAIRLAEMEPAADILLLEANFVGFGASGRNAGLLSPLAAPVWLVSSNSNPEHAWALKHLNQRTQAVAKWLATNVPSSEAAAAILRIESTGRLTAAALPKIAATLDKSDIEHEFIAATTVGQDPSGDRPGARKVALEVPSNWINPYRCVVALSQHAQSLGVRIKENCVVTAVRDASDGVELVLASGTTLQTKKAIVCTNAYSGSIDLPQSLRAKVVYNFMVSTPPLTSEQTAHLPAENTFVVELNRANAYYRKYAGRLIFGGIDKFSKSGEDDFDVPPDVLAGLEGHLEDSFPKASMKVSEAWGGRFHMTYTDLPQIERTGANGSIILNVGYGGTGVALTLVLSRIAAALATSRGITDPDDQRLFAAINSTRIPILSGARFGLGVAASALASLLRRKP